MKYWATPFEMREELINSELALILTREERPTRISQYNRRGDGIEVEADTAEEALRKAFIAYQNLDEDHMAPDGGRSLMVGDLIHLATDSDGDHNIPVIYRVLANGFRKARGINPG